MIDQTPSAPKKEPGKKAPVPNSPTKTPTDKKVGDRELYVKQLEVKVNVNEFFRKGLLYLFILLLFLPALFAIFKKDPSAQLTMSQLITDVREQKIKKLSVSGSEVTATYADESQKVARKEDGQQVVQVLEAADIDLSQVDVQVEDVSFSQIFWDLAISVFPILLMVIVFAIIFRRTQGAQGGIMGFGKSKARVFVKGKQDTKFANVGGMDEAKKELEEVVDFLRHPKKYRKVGARTPKGVLLIGPAGTGKTLLARAVAGEANVQFLSIAGSEFMEMLVGVGASRVRDLFDTAKKLAPSIIFIDEIDAIGRARGRGAMTSHDEREQTLNQILVEMDGFSQNDNVMVMAATNRGDLLDPALVRPGRFDRRVTLRLPDLEERKGVIAIHAKGKPFAKDVSWEKVARRTVGFSGADIENMLNEAAISAARESHEEITAHDIEEASLKVKLGPSKRRLQDKHEREMTAYHEAGHALVAHLSPNADPVHRISIVSRGRALGFTLTPPEKDKLQTTKSELIDRIAVLLGGRAAELQVFKELTAGASSDIEQATRIARAMVVEYGMSELGPINFGPLYDMSEAGVNWSEPAKISDKLQEKVDAAVAQLIAEGVTQAEQLMKKYRKQLDVVSKQLLESESLDGDEFAKLMGMEKVKMAE